MSTSGDALSWNSSSSIHSFFGKYWKELVIISLVLGGIYYYKENEKKKGLDGSNIAFRSQQVPQHILPTGVQQYQHAVPYHASGGKPIMTYDAMYNEVAEKRPIDVMKGEPPRRPDHDNVQTMMRNAQPESGGMVHDVQRVDPASSAYPIGSMPTLGDNSAYYAFKK